MLILINVLLVEVVCVAVMVFSKLFSIIAPNTGTNSSTVISVLLSACATFFSCQVLLII
jgi:hypothetical protein